MKECGFGRSEFLLVICTILLFLFISDVTLKHLIPPAYQATRYGWTNPENVTNKSTVQDSPGKSREITVEYFKDGFKRWGDVNSKKTKMLIVGDSFTDMMFVSNGEEWYSYLEKELNVELFVYGGRGYGSLQECMILDDYIDQIRPQLILIQFCDNDYINNIYDWDRSTYPNNNYGIRPYLENGRIVYRLPLPFSGLRNVSFIADRLLAMYDTSQWQRIRKNYKGYLAKKWREYLRQSKIEAQKGTQLEKEAVKVTKTIFGMIKGRVKDIPVYLYNFADDPRVEEICRTNNFTCISGITKEVDEREKAGINVRIVDDNHWNKLGNEIIGRKMVEIFRRVIPASGASL